MGWGDRAAPREHTLRAGGVTPDHYELAPHSRVTAHAHLRTGRAMRRAPDAHRWAVWMNVGKTVVPIALPLLTAGCAEYSIRDRLRTPLAA